MEIDKKIEVAFDSLEQINEVKISSSFKQQVLKLALEQEKEEILLTWFTPKLQMAAMIIVLLVNVTAIMYTFSTTSSETNISSFVQEYNLRTTPTFIIN